MTADRLTFGPYTLTTDGLLRHGMTVPLGGRALAILSVLARAEGQVVAKTALMDQVWPGIAVEEGNLTVQIAALRKALGQLPDGQDWIVTVARVGYRLISGVAGTAALPPVSVIPSLAVLPFQNLGGDAEQDYFADGVVEDIITALSRFKSFAVIARNSCFVYKGRAVDVRQVAKDLGVRYVLEAACAGPVPNCASAPSSSMA